MDSLKRRQKIEALLAGWFEGEGWDVHDGIAAQWFGNPWEPGHHEVHIDISKLADSLESQLERALA